MKKAFALFLVILLTLALTSVSILALDEEGLDSLDSITEGEEVSDTDTSTDFVITDGVLVEYLGDGGEVIIPAGVTAIGEDVFSQCTALTKVTIPEGVITIGKNAFLHCTGLQEVVFPNSLITVGYGAFFGCTGLTGELVIPANVTVIESQAFYGCSGLTDLALPSSLTTIGAWAFNRCNGLTEVTIPEGVTTIGDWLFYQNSGLTKVTLPQSLTALSTYAFGECPNLTEVTLPDGLTAIASYAFCGCTSLPTIEVPAGVTSIGQSAFQDCTSLTEIHLPEGVETIAYAAFESCTRLTEITLPKHLTAIGERAFLGAGLTEITFEGATVPTIGQNAFSNTSSLETVYVPVVAYEDYQSVLSQHLSENVQIVAVGTATAEVVTGSVTKKYETLDEAIAAAQATEGAVLRLLESVSSVRSISSGILTLDLNGYTYSGGGLNPVLTLTGETDLTVTDSSTEQTGKIRANYTTAFEITGNASLRIMGGTVETTGAVNLIVVNGKALTVSGGKLINAQLTNSSSHILRYKGTLTFEGHPDPTGIIIYNRGDALASPVLGLPEGLCFFNQADGIVCDEPAAELKYMAYYTIAKVPDEVVTEVTLGGTTTQYTTFRAAVAALAETGSEDEATLRLQKDIQLSANERLTISSGTFVLDLNGYSIINDSGMAINLTGNTALTLIDGSEAQTGKISASNYPFYMEDETTLTVKGGTLESTGRNVIIHAGGASLALTGGTLSNKSEGLLYSDISHMTGTVSLSSYPDPEGITIRQETASDIPASAYGLTGGYGFYPVDQSTGETIANYSETVTRYDYYIVGKVPVARVIMGGLNYDYSTVAEAFAAAAAYDGSATLRLLGNLTVTESLSVQTGYFTIDLCGYTLSINTEDELFLLKGDADLTLTDSSAAQTGKVSAAASVANIAGNAYLTINSGTLETTGEDSVILIRSGRLNLYGGTLQNTNAAGKKGAICHYGGIVSFQYYSNPVGITVYNTTGSTRAASLYHLADGWCFYPVSQSTGAAGNQSITELEDAALYIVGRAAPECAITETNAVVYGALLGDYADQQTLLLMAVYDSEGRMLGLTDTVTLLDDGSYEMGVEAEGIQLVRLFVLDGSYVPITEVYTFE